MFKSRLLLMFVFFIVIISTTNGCENKINIAETNFPNSEHKKISFEKKSPPDKVFLLEDYSIIDKLKEKPIEESLNNIGVKQKNIRIGKFIYIEFSEKDSKSILLFDNSTPSVLDSTSIDKLGVIASNTSQDILSEYDLNPLGDVLVIPTEAGIDTYLFRNSSGLVYIIPEEIP